MSDFYQSQYQGEEIDEQILFVKNNRDNFIMKNSEEFKNKPDSDQVVKYIEKNMAEGYAGLDENAKISSSVIPIITTDLIENRAITEEKLSEGILNALIEAVLNKLPYGDEVSY